MFLAFFRVTAFKYLISFLFYSHTVIPKITIFIVLQLLIFRNYSVILVIFKHERKINSQLPKITFLLLVPLYNLFCQ